MGNSRKTISRILRLANLLQYRQQVRDELRRVLAHREVAEALHDDRLRTRALRDSKRAFAGAGVVVFAGEQIEVGLAAVDLVDLGADVAVDLVEMQVAL